MSLHSSTQSAPYILGIETSTPAGGVALATAGGRLAAQTWRDTQAPVTQRLLGQIEALLREEGITRERIGAIAVTHGPGAFTGLRAGLAVAKTLAHGWGVRLYTYSTLAMLAARWPGRDAGGLVCPLLDARRGEIYSGTYRAGGASEDGTQPACVRADRVEHVEAFLDALAQEGEGPVIALGSGALVYGERLRERLGERLWIAPAPLHAPAADSVALAGAADFAAERAGVDPLQAAPVYLRASDAERRHDVDVALTWSAL